MNADQREAIQHAIDGCQDNLCRFELQRSVYPDWKSGNGEHIDQIISDLKSKIAKLKEGL